MRRIITFISCFLLCVVVHAQKKLFDNAVAFGRQPTDFYVLQNTKNKKLKLEDLTDYAQKNGYILGRSTEKEISRFGDLDRSVSTLEFLPKSEYESYIFSNIDPGNTTDLSKSKIQGSCYYYSGWDNSTLFKRLDNISWSGEVRDGAIEGKGFGYGNEGNSRIIFVEGTFEGGFPTGFTKTTTYDFGGNYGPFLRENVSVKSINVGKMSDGMAIIEREGSYGFVDSNGKLAISPKYPKVIQGFADGKAIVVLNNKESIIDKEGTFVDFTLNQKRIDKETAEITAGLTFRSFTEKATDGNEIYQAGLSREQIVDNLKRLGFTLLNKKTESRLDYTGEEYYDAVIESYTKTIYDRTTIVTLDEENVKIQFPNLNDVGKFVSSVKASGLKEHGNKLEDNEKIYWGGTDVYIEGTIVSLIFRWEP